jgi:Flp pilus assembly protein TadG
MKRDIEHPVTKHTRGDRRRGQAMVEFSLVFIVFLTLMMGIFELGRTVWIYSTVAHAVRQGSRFAMVHGVNNPANDALIARVKLQAIGLSNDSIQIVTTWEGGGIAGSFVKVDVKYPYQPAIAGPLFGRSDGFLIGSSSRTAVLN